MILVEELRRKGGSREGVSLYVVLDLLISRIRRPCGHRSRFWPWCGHRSINRISIIVSNMHWNPLEGNEFSAIYYSNTLAASFQPIQARFQHYKFAYQMPRKLVRSKAYKLVSSEGTVLICWGGARANLSESKLFPHLLTYKLLILPHF